MKHRVGLYTKLFMTTVSVTAMQLQPSSRLAVTQSGACAASSSREGYLLGLLNG